MSLVVLRNVSKAYGAQDVLRGVSAAVPHQARIGLVGPNGVGKSTLLRILAGAEKADSGKVSRAGRIRIGFLAQEDPAAPPEDRTLWEHALGAFDDLRRREQELAHLEQDLQDTRRGADRLARYGALQEAFERDGGYRYPALARQALRGLGFGEAALDRPLTQLSGGERTRAHLVRLLLEDPGLLLLDEPTNHLDLRAVEWLEQWLDEWPGAAVVVSHDRAFLDRTVEVVWELGPQGLEVFRGNYTAYRSQRQKRDLAGARAEAALGEYVRREQDYIRRNVAGRNARQARGRRKKLERELSGRAEAGREAGPIALRFAAPDRTGDKALETTGTIVAHPGDGRAWLRVPDGPIGRGECVAILGRNGAGKTTLLRTLIGERRPHSGEVVLGARVKVGYMGQRQEGLDPDRDALATMLRSAPAWSRSEALAHLARFRFTGDLVERPVAQLSGGERSRLALACLVAEGANLLALDEPTNHLDLPGQEALQQALAEFSGTVLMASHDRYLISALATQIWRLEPEAEAVEVFRGGYAEMMARPASSPPPRARHSALPARRRAAPPRLEALEARIASLEEERARAVAELERAGSDLDQVRRWGTACAELEQELERQYALWEETARREEPA